MLLVGRLNDSQIAFEQSLLRTASGVKHQLYCDDCVKTVFRSRFVYGSCAEYDYCTECFHFPKIRKFKKESRSGHEFLKVLRTTRFELEEGVAEPNGITAIEWLQALKIDDLED